MNPKTDLSDLMTNDDSGLMRPFPIVQEAIRLWRSGQIEKSKETLQQALLEFEVKDEQKRV